MKSFAQGFIISVRYFGRSAIVLAILSASAALPGLGGGVVRVATGTPSARNNSSCPAGEQMQSNRAGSLEAFVKEWGALAGILTVPPAPTTDFFAAKGGFDFTFEDGKRFLEVMAMRRRAASRRDVHVNEAITAGGVIAAEQNGIGVPHESDVAKAPVLFRVRSRKIAEEVVRRNRRDGLCYDRIVIHFIDFSSRRP